MASNEGTHARTQLTGPNSAHRKLCIVGPRFRRAGTRHMLPRRRAAVCVCACVGIRTGCSRRASSSTSHHVAKNCHRSFSFMTGRPSPARHDVGRGGGHLAMVTIIGQLATVCVPSKSLKQYVLSSSKLISKVISAGD